MPVSSTSTDPVPFRIEIPQDDLDDLQQRLDRTRWTVELPDVGWSFGLPVAHARELVEHWRTTYDWRAHEARLNELPQFTTTIDGAKVHFRHVPLAGAGRSAADPHARPAELVYRVPGRARPAQRPARARG